MKYKWQLSLPRGLVHTRRLCLLVGDDVKMSFWIVFYCFGCVAFLPHNFDISTETCRCPPKLVTNWWRFLPQETSSKTSQVEGIFPSLIRRSIDSKCGWCHDNSRTIIDFYEVQSGKNGTSQSALKMNLNEVIDSITSSDISFPLVKKNTLYIEQNFKFVEVFKLSTGVVYINRRLTAEVYASMVGSSVFHCWPLLFLIVVLSMLSGIILCLLVSTLNAFKCYLSFSDRYHTLLHRNDLHQKSLINGVIFY